MQVTDMLIILLFAQVTCEWVEISQQHYFKPLQPTRNYAFTTMGKSEVERSTKANRIYINNSLPDHNWNKGDVYKGLNVANQKRVQIESSDVRNKHEKTSFDEESDEKDTKTSYGFKNNGVISIPKNNLTGKDKVVYHEERQNDAIRRFFNNDEVKRIQLNNFKKPFKMVSQDMYKNRPLEVLNLSDLEYATEEDIFTTMDLYEPIANTDKLEHTYHVTADMPTIKKKTDSIRFTENNPFTNLDSSKYAETPNVNVKRIQSSTDKSVRIKQNLNKYNNTLESIASNSNAHKISIHGISTTEKQKRVQSINNSVQPTETLKINESAYKRSGGVKDHASDDKVPIIHNTVEIKRVSVNSLQKTFTKPPKPEKNPHIVFEPIKRPIIRSPEDVMLEDISNENNMVVNVPHQDKINENESNLRPRRPTLRPELATEIETFIDTEPNQNKFRNSNTAKRGQFSGTEETSNFTTAKDERKKTAVTKNESLGNVEIEGYKRNNYILQNRPEFLTSEEMKFEDEVTVKVYEPSINTNIKNNENIFGTESPRIEILEEHINKFSPKENKPFANDSNQDVPNANETLTNKTKENTMENLVKFLKVVTDTISKNTRRSFGGKLRYLENLKNTIMANIEERIESAFPDDTDSRRMRRSRHTRVDANARGHVEFPSSESALMTISFLTFAVFLIKLVLQVIQTYKNKTMMVPAVVATVGRAASEYLSRNMKNIKN